MSSDLPVFVTPQQLAKMLKVSPKTVAQWAREDPSMPVTRLGRLVRFEQRAILRWLQSRTRRTSRKAEAS